MSWLKRFIGGAPTAVFAPPAPESPLAVIGDVHGCLAQLRALNDQLDPAVPRIAVGDYVDRGEDSAGVLRWLHERPEITCLAGNHEAMMLGFLDAPLDKGPRWLKFGGLQTLASFGITGLTETADQDALLRARDALERAMGPDLLNWLRALPLHHQSGTVAVVHAGADPALPLAMQSDRVLMWGHPDFDRTDRRDGIWVVHGHTITPEPTAERGRIAVDTGAYATGRLTAVTLTPEGGIHFSTT